MKCRFTNPSYCLSSGALENVVLIPYARLYSRVLYKSTAQYNNDKSCAIHFDQCIILFNVEKNTLHLVQQNLDLKYCLLSLKYQNSVKVAETNCST